MKNIYTAFLYRNIVAISYWIVIIEEQQVAFV